jgi:chromosome segregation ATPase
LTDALTEATEGDKEVMDTEAFAELESKMLQEKEENSLKDTIIEELENEIASQKEHLSSANQCIEEMETDILQLKESQSFTQVELNDIQEKLSTQLVVHEQVSLMNLNITFQFFLMYPTHAF